MNSEKQAFGVSIEFDNPDQKVSSGANAEIHIFSTSDDLSIITPRKNIITENDENYVFIAQSNFAIKRKVVLGREHDLNVEILQGLNPGDLLITKGQMLLEDKMKIRIVNE